MKWVRTLLDLVFGGNKSADTVDPTKITYIRELLNSRLSGMKAVTPLLVEGNTELHHLRPNYMGFTALHPGTVVSGMGTTGYMALPLHDTVLVSDWSEDTPLLVYYGHDYYGLLFRAPGQQTTAPEGRRESHTGVIKPGTYLGQVNAGPLAEKI